MGALSDLVQRTKGQRPSRFTVQQPQETDGLLTDFGEPISPQVSGEFSGTEGALAKLARTARERIGVDRDLDLARVIPKPPRLPGKVGEFQQKAIEFLKPETPERAIAETAESTLPAAVAARVGRRVGTKAGVKVLGGLKGLLGRAKGFFKGVKRVQEIAKELEPLAVEARKFKTAEEFVKKIREVSKKVDTFQERKTFELTIKPLSESDRVIARLARLGKVPPTAVEKINIEKRATDFFNQAKETAQKVAPELDLPPAKVFDRKIVDQKFRGDKLDLPEEQLADVEKRLGALGLTKRTVKSFGEMQDAAQELGVDPKKLLRESEINRITDDEVVALRNTISTTSDFIVKAEREILEDASKELALRGKIFNANRQIDQAVKKLVKGGTEAGRAVVAFRILANRTLDFTFWAKKAQQVLGNRELTGEMQTAIRDLISKSDTQGLASFVSMLRQPSFAEKAITLWKAGLLTSPTTHLANIGGNVTMAALTTASDIVSTGLDILASLATGKRTTTITPGTVAAKFKGLKVGSQKARKFLKTGVYDTDILTKYDIPRQVNFENKILNGYTQGIFRSLGAEDILFRQAAMGEALEKNAIILAKNEGLRGAAQKSRVRELLLEPSNEMVMDAIDAAEFATFQGKNVLTDLISGGKSKLATRAAGARAKGERDIGAEVLLAITEFVAPFTRTPTNIAARIADFSPLGFVKAMVRAANPTTRSQKNLVEDLGRGITGSGIMAFGAYLANKGIMTGNVPENKKERDQFFAEGKQANSILVGDRWYQLNRVSPFGNVLSLGAEFERLSQEREGAGLAAATGFAGARGLSEQTFLKGISGGLKAITEPERQAERFAQQSVASTVPSVIGRTARTIDPRLRVPESIFQAVEARIPGLTGRVALRRDIFGEPIEPGGGRLNLIDPFASKRAVDDPVINEAKKIGTTIGLPSQTISKTRLTEKEYSIYQKVNGRIMKIALQQLIDNPQYQNLSSSEKVKEFEKLVTNVRSQMNDLLFPALMIKRFGLPQDTNPELLRDLLNELGGNSTFKKASDEKQARVVRNLLQKVAE